MFKIGDFSKFTHVSVKMLRHYDEMGLLRPERVDSFTGYRYYSAGQLPRLHRILALRGLGFSLEQIRTLLSEDLPDEQVRGMLRMRRAEISHQLAVDQARLADLDAHLAQFDAESNGERYAVVLRPLAPQPVAAIRAAVGEEPDAIAALFDEVEAYVARHNARAPAPPLMLYHDAEWHESAQDIEVAVPLSGGVPGTERIAVYVLSGAAQAACTIYTGSYEAQPQAYAALMRWLEAHNRHIAGPPRELFLRYGSDERGYAAPAGYVTTRSAEYVTELQLPVQIDGKGEEHR